MAPDETVKWKWRKHPQKWPTENMAPRTTSKKKKVWEETFHKSWNAKIIVGNEHTNNTIKKKKEVANIREGSERWTQNNEKLHTKYYNTARSLCTLHLMGHLSTAFVHRWNWETIIETKTRMKNLWHETMSTDKMVPFSLLVVLLSLCNKHMYVHSNWQVSSWLWYAKQ